MTISTRPLQKIGRKTEHRADRARVFESEFGADC